VGTIVIGTVYGDIHDIGKTIVAMLLRSRGFKVIDLGTDVAEEQFIEAVRDYKPNILALSALTSGAAQEMGRICRRIETEGFRYNVKIMIGGGAVTEAQAAHIRADGYHATARGAVEMAWPAAAG
jgi:5-methyltetrahydrofolate--homocysteine methyltransferase